MARFQRDMLNPLRDRPGCDRAVVFLHGLAGNRDDTWNRTPGLLGTAATDWDVYTMGYRTTLLPSLMGIWPVSPDLAILATELRNQASNDPLRRYRTLALVAHSMGGLIVQRALLDDPELSGRTEKVVLFGTPSAGLRTASWMKLWNRQFGNMAHDGDFIAGLRREWAARFGPGWGVDLRIVAAEQDQIVPPGSSLCPFPRHLHCVVPGDHFTMVRAADTRSPSLRLLASILSDAPVPDDVTAPLALAAEVADARAPELVEALGDKMSEQEVVRAALALERSGKRDQAMALLHRYQSLGTDVQGTLAGRIKRMWIQNDDPGFAQHALDLYQGALDAALEIDDVEQIYYLSINVAFLQFVAFDRVGPAEEMAKLALEKASVADESAWSVATQAEANLYLGRRDLAIDLYRRMLAFEAEPWQHASAALQAGQIASRIGDARLADELERIFTSTVRQAEQTMA